MRKKSLPNLAQRMTVMFVITVGHEIVGFDSNLRDASLFARWCSTVKFHEVAKVQRCDNDLLYTQPEGVCEFLSSVCEQYAEWLDAKAVELRQLALI